MSSKKKAMDVGADGKTWFSRTQAARFLGVDISAVRRAETRGSLAAVIVEGVHLFSRGTLETYRDSGARGHVAARAFQLYAQGKSAAEVVIELEILPATAEALLGSYAACSGVVIVAAPAGSRIAWERTYRLPAITPGMLLRAIEICARTPSLRAKLLA